MGDDLAAGHDALGLQHALSPPACIAAPARITQLVPPSLVLIVLADQLGKPVGDMYKGAWGPSILQVLLFALYTFMLSRIGPRMCRACQGGRARCTAGRCVQVPARHRARRRC